MNTIQRIIACYTCYLATILATCYLDWYNGTDQDITHTITKPILNQVHNYIDAHDAGFALKYHAHKNFWGT